MSGELFQIESNNLCELELQLNSSLIKCYIKIPPTESAIEKCFYPKLLDYIQEALNEICDFCLPSTQKPVSYLECPFDHEENIEHPHLLFSEISSTSSRVICKITNNPVPKEYYTPLLKSEGKLLFFNLVLFACSILHSLILMWSNLLYCHLVYTKVKSVTDCLPTCKEQICDRSVFETPLEMLLAYSVSCQFSDIGSLNQLSNWQKQSVSEKTRLFARNVP